MEARRLITAMLLAFLFWIVLQKINQKFWPQPPQPQTPATSTAPGTASQPGLQAEAVPSRPTTAATGPAPNLSEDKVRNDNITLGHSAQGNGYSLQATFSNHGAVLSTVQLSQYAESAKDKKNGYRLIEPVIYPSGTRYSLGTEQVILTDNQGHKLSIDPNNARWFYKVKTQADGQTLQFWIDIVQGQTKLAKLTKTYHLTKNSQGGQDMGFELTLQNLSDRPLDAVVRQEGFVGVRKEDPRSEDRKAFAGTIRSGREGVLVEGVARANLEKLADHKQTLGAVDERVVWSGQTNKYFAALMAAVNANGKLTDQWVDSVEARTYSTDPQLGEDLSTVWITKNLPLAPGKSVALNYDLYLGPKSNTIFGQGKYAERNYLGIFAVDKSMCTMQWLADLMTWLLDAFYLLTRNYGVAIILLVIIVRVILHPLTKSSQVSMMRMSRDMQRLQPKLNALKEKYKNNREALNKATMELYREEGINPAGQIFGCLPMLLQMPIWFALWSALNNTFALRHKPFFLWVHDLAGPDAIYHFPQPITIPLLSSMIGPIHDLNILPLILIASMFLQQMFSPQAAPNPDADPAQAKQQKFMMYFMSIFMGLIFYNAPSGLNLYILTSTLLGVVESRRIRQHLEEEQKRPPEAKKRSELSLWGRLQKRMEQYAQEFEKSKKTKR